MMKIDSEKLTIPIYLNTKIVFDMLATIEDGFSEIKNVQISSEVGKETAVSADIGTGNVFAWLNFGASANRKNNNQQSSVITEQRTHTTVSLFQKFRSILEENKLIKGDSDTIVEGDFVELQGTLKTNPLIDFLTNMQELMSLATVFDEKGGNKSKARKMMENQKLNSQIEALINGLRVDGKMDIICKTESKNVVVNTDANYFLNKSMSEITDGNYKILGKVTKICLENEEGISLLRNTAFSKLKIDKMKEFQELFNSAELKPFFGNENVMSVIEGPAIMVIPIAIFI
ncbi:DUF6414 family protein [Butyrivibrio fibrisolvens]|uniref:DUF6414 family protein n=1 Tax=Butyrivibrio fibrisolvens TaxID=831 RepID=UPI0003B6861B|nr:hypothetical protein [Butyrivibrio fibrisolvens]